MQIDRAALDDRLEEVALDELNADHDPERDQGRFPAVVRERDENGDEA